MPDNKLSEQKRRRLDNMLQTRHHQLRAEGTEAGRDVLRRAIAARKKK